jgi:hypothetical protein
VVEAGVGVESVARGAGVTVVTIGGAVDVDVDGTDVVPAVVGVGCAPAREECASLCEANRIATLSNATVNVTRRLNRITSTRNALVCTVLLHHGMRPAAAIVGGESPPRYPR